MTIMWLIISKLKVFHFLLKGTNNCINYCNNCRGSLFPFTVCNAIQYNYNQRYYTLDPCKEPMQSNSCLIYVNVNHEAMCKTLMCGGFMLLLEFQDSLDEANVLMKRHEDFEKTLNSQDDQVRNLEQIAKRHSQDQHPSQRLWENLPSSIRSPKKL